MIKDFDKSNITTNPFVVSKNWYVNDKGSSLLTYDGLFLSDLANPILNYPYTQSIDITGGTPAYTFEIVSGSLPIGLTMNTTGIITGIPTTIGTFNFNVHVIDINGVNGDREYNFELIP